MAPKVQGTRNDSVHRLPPSFLSAKTLQHCKHTGLNQAYFTRSLIINTFFASLPGVNFIRKKARVCGSIASSLYAVCLYRAYGRWTLSLHIYIMNSCSYWFAKFLWRAHNLHQAANILLNLSFSQSFLCQWNIFQGFMLPTLILVYGDNPYCMHVLVHYTHTYSSFTYQLTPLYNVSIT